MSAVIWGGIALLVLVVVWRVRRAAQILERILSEERDVADGDAVRQESEKGSSA